MIFGYSYWGYLGDTKYDKNGNVASTPDGNAFYSWSIIHRLLTDGNRVIQVMPDRDVIGYEKEGDDLFSWCKEKRSTAYKFMKKAIPNESDIDWKNISQEDIFIIWDNIKLYSCDAILHEWRMLIAGRNDSKEKQPDYFLQMCLIEYCKRNDIKLIIFDLDYKLDKSLLDSELLPDKTYIFELGNKWKGYDNCFHVEIPFDFESINEIPINNTGMLQDNLVYIGNRYERDWCITGYIPTELSNVTVYGNWLESNRDSKERWPKINFGKRLQTNEMVDVYNDAVCTILLAKSDYVDNGFMTARIIESIFYGCVPLFIEEYGSDIINKYAGIYASALTVTDKSDVIDKVMLFKYYKEIRNNVINYLREHLSFMDVKYFVRKIYDICNL